MERRKRLPRSTKPLKRTSLRRIGPRGRRKKLSMRIAKAQFFTLHGEDRTAACQWCGMFMEETDCAAHHKVKRSLGGNESQTNLMILHHACHDYVHESKQNYETARDSKANALTGRTV